MPGIPLDIGASLLKKGCVEVFKKSLFSLEKKRPEILNSNSVHHVHV